MLFRGAVVLEFDVALGAGFGVEIGMGVSQATAATETDQRDEREDGEGEMEDPISGICMYMFSFLSFSRAG